MALVSKRYAEALIALAVEKDSMEEFLQQMTAVAEIYKKESAFREFLLSPKNGPETKKKFVASVFEGRLHQDIVRLLFLLITKNRLADLPGISLEFARMADERRNVLNVTIMSAAPLDQAQLDKICDRFCRQFHASSVKVKTELDPTLIGGVKVAIGDKLYDGTVKGKLDRLQTLLAGQ